MSTAIATFAKTPGLSQVKTRLAEDIGKDKAEEFYNLSVKATEEMLLELKHKLRNNIEVYWALAEENGVNNTMWSKFEAVWTGEGDLGKRLFNISDKLLKKHDNVILIGTDSPQLNSELLSQVIDILNKGSEDCVIGPAYDGGFYLFGCTNSIPEQIWTSVTYSKANTLKQLLNRLKEQNIPYSLMKYIGDVDEEGDLQTLYDSLYLIKDSHSSSQAMLFEWLEAIK